MAIQPQGNAGVVVEVETNTRAMRSVIRPIDYGSLGIYTMAVSSGTMAAGLGGASPIVSFRNSTSNVYLLKRVLLGVCGHTTAWTAGVCTFNMFAARSFTANDTGGTAFTLTTNNGKLRTTMATTGVADIRASTTATLTAGTRTKDTQPLSSFTTSVTAVASLNIVPPQTPIFNERLCEMPYAMAANEGWVIEATVPATGTWVFSTQMIWEEVSSY